MSESGHPTGSPYWMGFEEWCNRTAVDLKDSTAWLPWWRCWYAASRNMLDVYQLQG